MTPPTIAGLVLATPPSLGSYGPLIQEIEAALRSPQCSLGVIGDIIEKDVDLTARLLRFSNSAYCGFSTKLSTVSEAISLIGIQQVQDMLSASSVLERFAGLSSEFVSVQSFWQHSLATGIAARLIALDRRLPKPDRLFVAGLLHDVGRLVLFLQSPKYAQMIFEVYGKERLLLRKAEVSALGFDHQNIGEALLKSWKYPPTLVLAVGHHHDPAGCEAARVEAAVVHVADHLVNAMRVGSSGEKFVPPLNSQAWATIGLTPEALGPIVAGIDEQFDAVQEMFLGETKPEANA
ncbi:MAG: HDOD domain-containing protein [Verrucomicrobia subdivision 3 bacterium]|nr:HDOD domain-containing protein [Limisphaerales bacterium]